MANDPDLVKLIRRFEPVLYFHPAERFFPGDAKRYIERCALWRAEPVPDTNGVLALDEKEGWGGKTQPFPRQPMIARGKISAMPGEAAAQGDTELATMQGASFTFLESTADDERFLDPAGWASSVDVTAASEHRGANLDALAADYADDGPLEAERFWYHCEFIGQQRLRAIMAAKPGGLDMSTMFARLENPALLCYHLFFPGHDEPLDGCEGFGGGSEFGSFAGAWACIVVLLERDQVQPNFQGFRPSRIGVTSRNVGVLQDLDGERRVGMTVHDWGLLTRVESHPRLFVALGTHSLYLKEGVVEATPFTPGGIDVSRQNCGHVEDLDEVLRGVTEPPGEWNDAVLALKIASSILTFGIGLAWTIPEIPPFGTAPPNPSSPQVDRPPEPGAFGRVVRSKGLVLPNAAEEAQAVDWRADEVTLAGRAYNFVIDRDEQVWWPPREGKRGYTGRWGPRVTHDPNTRRTGMLCPDFVTMFVSALAKT